MVPRFLTAFGLLLFVLCAFGADQARAIDIQDVRFGQHPDKVRMVMELNETSDYRVFMLDDPYRLVIDLPRFEPDRSVASKLDRAGGDPVKKLRWGHLNQKISRMVVDLSAPVKIDSSFLLPPKTGFPARLVIDFQSTSVEGFEQARDNVYGTLSIKDIRTNSARNEKNEKYVQPTQKPQKAAASHAPPAKPDVPRQKPLIIIDPGHGGIDPGAIASNGMYEKDIVLKLSHELKGQLERTGRFRVKMTRQDDRFLRLRDRVNYARRHKGNLFISVHADSLEKSYVSGASVYTLSERSSDAQTARLARRENQADLIAGVDLASEGKEVANILIDLAMRDTMNQSSYFANTLVAEMQQSNINTLENPHRFAGFAVLKAPDIPSVLVEAGFLSNRREADKLATSSYRRAVARSIVKGIESYYDKVEKNRRS